MLKNALNEVLSARVTVQKTGNEESSVHRDCENMRP